MPVAVGSSYPLVPGYGELTRLKTGVYAYQELSGSEDAIVSMFDEYGL